MATRTTSSPRTLVAIVVGLTVMVALMLLAFAAPALNSGPKDLPLAVSGPEQATSRVTAALDEQAPGTFDVTTYATEQEGAEAIADREAIGGIAVGAKGVTVQTATGAGAAYTQVLKGVGAGLEKSGQKVTYVELAPTTTDDPQAVGVSTLGLPLVFGGMAGDYWLTSLSISAGILAISATVLGLGTLVGAPGIGIGAVTMLFVANPLSGLANGPQWLPGVWGEVGQLLPVGAAGSLVRSVAFFDGGGAMSHLVVLAVWIVLGVALAGVGVAGQGRGTHVATAEREEALASA